MPEVFDTDASGSCSPGSVRRVELQQRLLGTTGMDLTAVGFGAWAAGGSSWGGQDDDDSIAAIRHAVAHGVNWLDTAPVYGLGHSEEVVRRALADLSDDERPFVFTKCGLVWDEDSASPQPRSDLRPESIRRECDASLRRLGVERIDLYQFHWPDPATPVEESWGAMQQLITAGKVRAGAVSNFSVELLEACEPLGHVASLQPPFSLVERGAGADVLPWCDAHDTGVIVYSPLQSGLLTGAFDTARAAALPPDDWRSRSPHFREPALSATLALVDALRPVAERHGVAPAVVAIAWTLAWPGVTGAIVGARNPAQVDGWLLAANLRLTNDDMDELAAAITRTGAGSGPLRPPDLDPADPTDAEDQRAGD
jgi:aryl-alcohol dehydrogenase-like predicted oxidoreductase